MSLMQKRSHFDKACDKEATTMCFFGLCMTSFIVVIVSGLIYFNVIPDMPPWIWMTMSIIFYIAMHLSNATIREMR